MTARRRRIFFVLFNRFVTPLSCVSSFFFLRNLSLSFSPHFFIFVAAARAEADYTRKFAFSIQITERNGVTLASLLFVFFSESEDAVQILLFFLRAAVGILFLLAGKDKNG